MSTIDLEIKINKSVNVSIDIEYLIENINELPLIKRWNIVAKLINGFECDLNDLTKEQKK